MAVAPKEGRREVGSSQGDWAAASSGLPSTGIGAVACNKAREREKKAEGASGASGRSDGGRR